ncbi:hypothetical protein E2C01_002372 [Portunus trituberculatus]|uniref:Uncharacterized protein n=1 Tax=Portunus trituberculatus TaxID=210409 RepID=A0A5B7CM38_PORTR|nr:hypothetical protein [Portunus trituberculatus]
MIFPLTSPPPSHPFVSLKTEHRNASQVKPSHQSAPTRTDPSMQIPTIFRLASLRPTNPPQHSFVAAPTTLDLTNLCPH